MIELIIIILGIGLDQACKLWASGGALAETMEVIPGIINFRYVENTGMAFGMLGDMTIVLTILSGVVSLLIIYALIFQRKKMSLGLRIMLAFVLAGAVGNLIDRIFLGYVVDFIEFDFVNFAVFNVADCYLTLSVIALVAYLLFYYEKDEKTTLLKNYLTGEKKKDLPEEAIGVIPGTEEAEEGAAEESVPEEAPTEEEGPAETPSEEDPAPEEAKEEK